MNIIALYLITAILVFSSCVRAEKETSMLMSEEITDMMEDTSEERKKQDTMAQMYMAYMMFKTFVTTVIMVLSPIIQIKSVGLSIIGTLINAGRFLMQVKQFKDTQMNEKRVTINAADSWGHSDTHKSDNNVPPYPWMKPYPHHKYYYSSKY